MIPIKWCEEMTSKKVNEIISKPVITNFMTNAKNVSAS